ncbi:MAG: hypothetical protein LBE67_15440 [Kocuria palustris]|nr:hypothetical protein [Kocuria palustris]
MKRKGKNTRKAKSYPCVHVRGERLPLLKIRQKRKRGKNNEMALTEIRRFTILGVKKRDGQVRTWLDLAFDIDDTVGGCFGLIEQ